MIIWFYEINNYDFQKTKLPKSHHRDSVVGKNKFELFIIIRQLRKGLKTLDNKTLYSLRLCVHENCEANQLFTKIQYHLTVVWAADVIKRPDYNRKLLTRIITLCKSSHAMTEKILSTRENSTKSHKNFFLILTICIAFKRGEMSKYNLLPYLKCLKFLPLPNHTFTPFFSSIIVECISMICIVCNRFL